MRQYQLWVSYLPKFRYINTLPELCQIYPLSFDRMKGIKHLMFMIENATLEYHQVDLLGNGCSRLFYAGEAT